ncbi:hypothetical protein GPECTOR_48g439 [Gonium pectorale]|uniref:Uncharacterized protein n=1 Tax=Gonium pectorale TaxID=33097 RepID=A0A150G835_GONPE|nr:hypothetical protein GPECTOR_48g439 [Gonium pectorale]|eukprot:KXZ46007.1 hypothetical protein GPECTOR_48g439 [Gonium pectorale]
MIMTSRPGFWHRHLPGPPAAAAAGGRLRARPITSIPAPKAAPGEQEATPPERRPSEAPDAAPAPAASPPPRHAGAGGDVTHGSLPSPCPPPEAPPLPPSPPASAPRVITLVFPSGRSISAQRTALWNVSRVIRAALSQAPPQVERLEVGPWRRRVGGGVPEEEEDVDEPACWEVVVQMAEMSAYPPQLVNWGDGNDDDDDADPLGFMGQHLRDCLEEELVSALEPLSKWWTYPDDAQYPASIASRLRQLIRDEAYPTAISAAVQAKVLDAILGSIKSGFPGRVRGYPL